MGVVTAYLRIILLFLQSENSSCLSQKDEIYRSLDIFTIKSAMILILYFLRHQLWTF